MNWNGSEKSDPNQAAGPERFPANPAHLENYRFLISAAGQIRAWMKQRGYTEVIIPCLSPETVPDLNLESFSLKFQSVFDPEHQQELFLQTSPELMMKRLLAAGLQNIFYLGPAFRQGELSKNHHPEFTILEWYRTGSDYLFLMRELDRMLSGLFGIKKIPRISMREALKKSAGWDFRDLQDPRKFARFLQKKIPGLKTKGSDWPELFERALLQWLEPWLAKQDAVFVYDWPSQLSMQAKLKDADPMLCQRFELYLKGREIANGYTEATDPGQMKKRLQAEIQKRKKLGRKNIPLPRKFLHSLELGLTPCAGVSLGLDRLCLALLNLDSLNQLLPFREI